MLCTFVASPAGDGTGVVGRKLQRRKGDTDGPHSWVRVETLLLVGQFLQLDERDVVLIGARVVVVVNDDVLHRNAVGGAEQRQLLPQREFNAERLGLLPAHTHTHNFV